jgi:hypothetical protein
VHALRGERVVYRDMIHKLRAAETSFEELGDTLASISGDDEESSSLMDKVPYNEEIRETIHAAIIAPLWRYVWSYEDERRLLEQVQGELTAADDARAQRSVVPLKSRTEKSKYSGRYRASSMLMPPLVKAARRAFHCEAHREMTVTAIALKRYQLRHGRYPEHLHQLIPQFLRENPIDWMDGRRLRYRLEGESFALWSVGDNGIDNEGKPDESEPYNFYFGADLVWPQPASRAEVEQYYERMKKKP